MVAKRQADKKQTPMDRMRAMTAKLMAVPKSDLDAAELKARQKRAAKKRKAKQ